MVSGDNRSALTHVAGGAGRMDLDLRKLRYFVAVAERLHFGRAAAVLYITQPALSRQIRQFEEELGVSLLERSSRQVTLTAAGKRLAEDGARLLADSEAAVARARRAQESGQCLTVGFMLGMDIAPVMAEFSRIHPGVEIQLQRLRWWNHAAALRDGRVDAGFVRLPLPTEGLQVQALYQEPVCVALPARHPLAGMASIGIAELAGEPVLLYADASPEWNAFWTFDPRPDGSHPPPGPYVNDMEEIVAYVRAGRGVAYLPVPITASIAPAGVTFVRVDDTPPGQVVLAWDADRAPPHIAELVSAARSDLSRPQGVVHGVPATNGETPRPRLREGGIAKTGPQAG
jgi:DNA-binding transcriptional LysR family regulator